MKNNGEVIPFLKQKDYIMVNNELGEGSFGKTVLLQDPFINELFVAKKYEPEYGTIKETFYKNFLEEIKILYKLNHRNIVRIYNYYAYENNFTGYILMEYIEGKDIGRYITEYIDILEDISLDEMFVQLIDGFCYIEEHGIIHRDIREGNILIDNNGIVKIIDFGIGKMFDKKEKLYDSLVKQINRENSDTLPQEYYEGIYTSQTDMFYLGELLHRLLNNVENIEWAPFSYMDIVCKMMQKKPENRYSTFREIKEVIGKHDFLNMNITEEDKKIYQEFSGYIYMAISEYTGEIKYNNSPEIFISRVEKVLRNNLFEDIIQKNDELISCIVVGPYRYKPNIKIPRDVVESFIEWFKESTQKSQELIISNLISKISKIRIKKADIELPF